MYTAPLTLTVKLTSFFTTSRIENAYKVTGVQANEVLANKETPCLLALDKTSSFSTLTQSSAQKSYISIGAVYMVSPSVNVFSLRLSSEGLTLRHCFACFAAKKLAANPLKRSCSLSQKWIYSGSLQSFLCDQRCPAGFHRDELW